MDKVKIAVVGGGITGRLFQFLVPEATIYDWMPHPRAIMSLTRNYGANYLWQPLDGIPCRQFLVVTHIDGAPATLDKIRLYKSKVGKINETADWDRQFKTEMEGYDFLALPQSHIQYGHRIVSIDRHAHEIAFAAQAPIQYDILISTIPLYALLSLLSMDEPPGRLQFKPIFFKVARRPPDAPYPQDIMYVNYITNPDVGPYRFCDRFGERHYESIVPFDGPSTRRIQPGKIYPHPGVAETLEILEGFNIFTFGRYGSWAPDELVHETYTRIQEWRAAMEDTEEVR